MAESTLNLGYADLIAKTGIFLGWGRGLMLGGVPTGDPAYTASQQYILDDAVASGVRQFYFPPSLQPGGPVYDWSFLHPTASLDLPNAAKQLQMPDDFGGFEGELTCFPAGSPQTAKPWSMRLYNEGKIREMFSTTPTAQGPPMFGGLSPIKGTTQVSSTRTNLLIFPAADQEYTVQFQYYILPDYLTGNNPYVYGGAAHAETILESCLAIAEQRMNMMPPVHSAKFMERLAASIGMDRKNKAQVLGYNGDGSDQGRWGRYANHWNFPPATYNGQSFG